MNNIVSFTHVTKTFGDREGDISALQDVSLSISPGSITGVIGHSGAGKSTLVRLINGLEAPTSGTVRVNGENLAELEEKELRKLRSRTGMIFQHFNLFASRSVSRNVEYPLRLAGWSKDRRRARVAQLLDFVGVAEKARMRPAQLSGGQRQRVGIARALATDPMILLADEATSALDPETSSDVLALLARVNRELGTTIVVVTHEMEVVRSVCDQVVLLESGRLVESGDAYDVFAHSRNPLTRRFIDSTMQDTPSIPTVRRLMEAHVGRLITVPVLDPGTSDGVGVGAQSFADVLDDVGWGVRAEVVYGSVSEIAARPFGSLTYALRGEPARVQAVVERLSQTSTTIDWSQRLNEVNHEQLV